MLSTPSFSNCIPSVSDSTPLIKSSIVQWEENIHTILLYSPRNYASITRFIGLLGVAEPDQVFSGVIVGIMYGVIHMPCSQAQ